MSKVFDLWKEIGGAFGPSGREDAVREAIAAAAGDYVDDITTDALGNLICRKKGSGKKLLFAAHMDSIGVVATYIDEKGFIRFSQVGGLFHGGVLRLRVELGVRELRRIQRGYGLAQQRETVDSRITCQGACGT